MDDCVPTDLIRRAVEVYLKFHTREELISRIRWMPNPNGPYSRKQHIHTSTGRLYRVLSQSYLTYEDAVSIVKAIDGDPIELGV